MSALVEWSDDLSVGIDEIDEQHKVLVDLLNEFHEAIQQHKGSEVASEILKRLGDYTRIHFAVEESIMRLLDYPDYENHKIEHDSLIDELNELVEKLQSGKKSVNFELLHFLKLWLTKHIRESDAQYTPHFISMGVKTANSPDSSLMGKMWGRIWG